MSTITLAAAVLNQTPFDWDGNQQRIVTALRAARTAKVGLLCLPELCITGYGCEDGFHGPDVVIQAERVLSELLPETLGIVVCVGLPRLHHRALYNTVAVVADGKILGFVAKQHLAGDGIHYEPRWFKPWPEGVVATTQCANFSVPLGDLLFDVGGIRFGFEICEDAWVSERPGVRLAAYGIDVLLNPSASHFAFDKLGVRQRFVTEGSRAFGCAYVYANLLGNEAGRAIYDGGALIAVGGRIVAQGQRLTCHDVALTSASVDVITARSAQARSASFRPEVGEHPGIVRVSHGWPAGAPLAGVPSAGAPLTHGPLDVQPWEQSEHTKEEEFTRAEALALFDYLRKSNSQGFVVSLSGGCDSTAVVCLLRLMIERALADLGVAGVHQRLAHIRGIQQAGDASALMSRLVTTVYQGTANSSAVTREAARVVAEAVGATHLDVDVDPLVRGYVATIAHALGRQPTWEKDDLALQNIQARVRAPSVWLIANLEDKLLLTTSNRSEAAVGYATMDGDTCGGLAPIAGIDKAFLRRWLEWLARSGPSGHPAMPAIRCVTEQRSTPELRPASAGQVSETDLMPFPLLDRIERLAIRDKLPPVDILERLLGEYPEHAPAQLQTWIERFTTLWCRNQWKRERFAPAFHLDDENLDPKTWCRFPILSGGFRRELAAMRARPG